RCSTNRYEPGPLLGNLSESPMPIRSGAMQRPSGCSCGNTLRQRYDEVGLPCSSTMGSPSPTSTYAISLPRIRRRCFWYGNSAEIMLASPSFVPSTLGLLESELFGHEKGAVLEVSLFPSSVSVSKLAATSVPTDRCPKNFLVSEISESFRFPLHFEGLNT